MLRAQLRGHAQEHGCAPRSSHPCTPNCWNFPETLALLAPRDGPNATQVHELALAVTYYGVTAESIASVTADKDFSVCETRQGYTDFAKVAFTITTADGSVVTIQADRCGGNNSQASALRCTARSDGGCLFIYSRNWSFLTGGGLWVAL